MRMTVDYNTLLLGAAGAYLQNRVETSKCFTAGNKIALSDFQAGPFIYLGVPTAIH